MRPALAAVVSALVLLVSGPGRSEPETGTPQWRALQRRIARDRVRARFMRGEERSILRGLRTLEENQARIADQVTGLEERLEGLAESRAALDARKRAAEARLNALRRRAGRRLAGMVRLRQTSVAAIVAAAAAGGRVAARRLQDRFRFAVRFDRSLVAEAGEAAEEIARTAARLARERRAVLDAQVDLGRRLEAAERLEIERQALLEAVREERRSTERLVEELRAARRQLEEEMGRIRGLGPAPEAVEGGFGAQRGRLPWPVAGRVEVTFGKRVDPGSDVVLVSQGIDVRAGQSEPVRAVFPGRVAYASNLDGYGRTVILAHEGGDRKSVV